MHAISLEKKVLKCGVESSVLLLYLMLLLKGVTRATFALTRRGDSTFPSCRFC